MARLLSEISCGVLSQARMNGQELPAGAVVEKTQADLRQWMREVVFPALDPDLLTRFKAIAARDQVLAEDVALQALDGHPIYQRPTFTS